MNSRTRYFLKQLRVRWKWLRDKACEKNKEHGQGSGRADFYLSEALAIDLAIRCIEKCDQLDLLRQIEEERQATEAP